MNYILREYLDVIAVGILCNVIIYSVNPSEHVQHVHSILQVLQANHFNAKIEKYEFHKE